MSFMDRKRDSVLLRSKNEQKTMQKSVDRKIDTLRTIMIVLTMVFMLLPVLSACGKAKTVDMPDETSHETAQGTQTVESAVISADL